jgi:hypothetical protein
MAAEAQRRQEAAGEQSRTLLEGFDQPGEAKPDQP